MNPLNRNKSLLIIKIHTLPMDTHSSEDSVSDLLTDASCGETLVCNGQRWYVRALLLKTGFFEEAAWRRQ